MQSGLASIYSKHRLALAIMTACSALASASVGATEEGSVVPEETMVVTGSRIEQRFKDVAGMISVVDQQQLSEQVTTDLADAFRYDPSISSTGGAGGAQTLTVRGIGGNRLLFIKDGRRLNDAYEGEGSFLVGRGYLDVTQIQQIEVAKSAASSLYGSDGLGGIVLIRTPDPAHLLQGEERFAQVTASGRTANSEGSLGFASAADFGGWQGMLMLNHRRGGATQNYSETLPEFDFDNTSLLSKATIDVSATQQLKFTLDHFEQNNEQIITAGSFETQERDRQTAFSIDFRDRTTRAWADQVEAQVYVTDYQQRSEQIRSGADRAGAYLDFNDYRFEQQIFGLRWQAARERGLSRWVYGVDADFYDTVRPRTKTRVAMDGTLLQDEEPQLTFPGAETTMAGLFAQHTYTFANDLQFIAGVRADYYRMQPQNDPLYDIDNMATINETALSPKLGIVRPLTANTNVYAQYTRGFSIPPHDQAYQSHGLEPFYEIIPNADLRPEKSDAFELGVKHSGQAVAFTAALFWSDFDQFIEAQTVSSEPSVIPGVNRSVFQYQNIESARIYGAELGAEWYLAERWTLGINGIWMSGENRENNTYLTSISPLSGSLQARYDGNSWHSTLALRGAAAMNKVSDPELIRTAGWVTADWMFGFEVGQWQVNLSAQNLLDKRYVPFQSVAGQTASIDTEQFTQPGRSLALRVTHRW